MNSWVDKQIFSLISDKTLIVIKTKEIDFFCFYKIKGTKVYSSKQLMTICECIKTKMYE